MTASPATVAAMIRSRSGTTIDHHRLFTSSVHTMADVLTEVLRGSCHRPFEQRSWAPAVLAGQMFSDRDDLPTFCASGVEHACPPILLIGQLDDEVLPFVRHPSDQRAARARARVVVRWVPPLERVVFFAARDRADPFLAGPVALAGRLAPCRDFVTLLVCLFVAFVPVDPNRLAVPLAPTRPSMRSAAARRL